MLTGKHKQPGILPHIAHTPSVLSSLESLAAACQSRRAVLLEGPTASGKTALPRELARLSQQRLQIISLTADAGRQQLSSHHLGVCVGQVACDGTPSMSCSVYVIHK
jgi:midasin (ATPase involved in ribosome maturation)